jgi:hypothetical protein
MTRSALGALLVVGKAADAGDEYAFDLVLARAVQHARLALDRADGVVMGMRVADGDNIGLRAGQFQTQAAVVRVGHHGGVLAAQPEHSVPKPGNFCHVKRYSSRRVVHGPRSPGGFSR